MSVFSSIATWDMLLCALGFGFLIFCLTPCRVMRTAWRGALLVVLYSALFAMVVAGFVHAVGWAAPLAPLHEGIEAASGWVGRIVGADGADVRPWVVLTLTAAAVLACLVVIQMVSVGRRLDVMNRVLRRLNGAGCDDATESPAQAGGWGKPAPRDDIQTARDGLSSLIRRTRPRGKQSLHKWLQG
jgi:hypothetical protein